MIAGIAERPQRLAPEFRAEVFNVENRPTFGTPNPTVFASGVASPSAGLITTTVTASRQTQFGLKMIFKVGWRMAFLVRSQTPPTFLAACNRLGTRHLLLAARLRSAASHCQPV